MYFIADIDLTLDSTQESRTYLHGETREAISVAR